MKQKEELEIAIKLTETLKGILDLKANHAKLKAALEELACEGNWSEDASGEPVWVGHDVLCAADFAKEALKEQRMNKMTEVERQQERNRVTRKIAIERGISPAWLGAFLAYCGGVALDTMPSGYAWAKKELRE